MMIMGDDEDYIDDNEGNNITVMMIWWWSWRWSVCILWFSSSYIRWRIGLGVYTVASPTSMLWWFKLAIRWDHAWRARGRIYLDVHVMAERAGCFLIGILDLYAGGTRCKRGGFTLCSIVNDFHSMPSRAWRRQWSCWLLSWSRCRIPPAMQRRLRRQPHKDVACNGKYSITIIQVMMYPIGSLTSQEGVTLDSKYWHLTIRQFNNSSISYNQTKVNGYKAYMIT